MKTHFTCCTAILFFALQSCSNESKDSVEIADSINATHKEMADSAGLYTPDSETATFLVNASNGAMAEIKLGELAINRATDTHVKALAQLMINEHSAANKEVKLLASARKISLPEGIAADEEKDIKEKMSRPAKEFDRAYVRYMIADHEKDIDLFKKAIDKVNDAEVRTFANNTLPKLQLHLDSFKILQKRIE